MKYTWLFKSSFFSLVLLLFALPLFGAQEEGKVEIVIKNSTYEFHGGLLRPNIKTTIVLRNEDDIQHGFISSLFEKLQVQVETDSGDVFGKGIKGVHINPGQSFWLKFVPSKAGKFSFRCDLHPGMKGELLMLSVDAT